MKYKVAPHAGAWIETLAIVISYGLNQSLLMQERGLKLWWLFVVILLIVVAPHAGAWIETIFLTPSTVAIFVAPHAGAWIETLSSTRTGLSTASLLMQERGLKL